MKRALIALLFALPATATTRHVEKDGTGDFTIIQDALDVAADGDTVRVGPGSFGDLLFHIRPQDNYQFYGIAWITRDVVLLGAGMDQTSIAPPSEVVTINGYTTRGVLVDVGANAHVEGFTIEKMRHPAAVLNHSTWVANRIVTSQNYIGMALLLGSQTVLVDCQFMGKEMLWTGNPEVTWLQVAGCSFQGIESTQTALVIGNGSTNARITDCSFAEVGAGVSVQLSGSAWIENCTFDQIANAAIDMDQGAAIVRNCRIEPGANYSLRVSIGQLEVYDSVIGGGRTATILTAGEMIVRNSHILNGGGLTVQSIALESEPVDLRENWWGTTNLTTIGGWIDDQHGAVIIDPILDHSVSTTPTSFGDIKAWFGGGNPTDPRAPLPRWK